MSVKSERRTIALVAATLERRDWIRIVFSVGLLLVGALLEMVSLGMIIPLVQLIVRGDQRSEFDWLPSQLRDVGYESFVVLTVVALIVAFVIKNLFLLASQYFQQRMQQSINNRIVQRLFETYLRQPYEFHLTNSSALLLRNVQEYSAAVVNSGLGPMINICSDLITGIGLLAVLVAVDAVSTLVMILLFAVNALLLLGVSRARTRSLGAERVLQKGILVESLMSGFGGVKEIKLFGRDQEVLATHRESLYKASRSFYLFNVMLGIPRALFEIVAVLGIGLLVILAMFGEGELGSAAVVIALFGVVAFRMLPSVTRAMQSFQQLSFGRAGIEGAVTGLSLPMQATLGNRNRSVDTFRELRVESLRYAYPATNHVVVDVPYLVISSGESIGLIGSSGSGKSTLADLLIGVLTPSTGSVTVNGQLISKDLRQWQDRIGYVPQHVYLMDSNIRRNVAFGLPEALIDEARVEEALATANLLNFVQSLPAGLDTPVGERGVRLSGGQRQRLGIARALYGKPEVLVLDEATSALDPETEREIVESLQRVAVGRTLVIVAHRVSTLKYCSRLLRMEHGEIVADGSFEQVVGSVGEPSDRGQ